MTQPSRLLQVLVVRHCGAAIRSYMWTGQLGASTASGKGPPACAVAVLQHDDWGCLQLVVLFGSVVVIGDPDSSAHLSGFMGAYIASSGTSELCATTWASLWPIQALSRPRTNTRLVSLATGVRQFAAASMTVTSRPIKAHSGEPWNGLADVLSDTISRRVYAATYSWGCQAG